MRTCTRIFLSALLSIGAAVLVNSGAQAGGLKPGEELDFHVIVCKSEDDAKSILDTHQKKGYIEALKVYKTLMDDKKCGGADFSATFDRQVAKYANLSFDPHTTQTETWYILEVENNGIKAYVLSPVGVETEGT